ncbi:MAG: lipoyl synthase [Acidobacteriota bacterium]|jgi:lipoic acid synthetase|nr:lipoyl synthase [Acidobacteriota bacterium]NLT33898.1 lipoyl synthase [Acidobacteriota bacterium]
MKPAKARPEWLKVKLPAGEGYFRLKRLVEGEQLHTVCRDARCPNIGECWGAGTATFMILGDVCTRACRFCAVKSGKPLDCDLDEPRRVAVAVEKLRLRYVVVTSVDRDDLPDGGASIFAETIRRIRAIAAPIRIEVLVPDFGGALDALEAVVAAAPDVLGHNVETVPRLYPLARPGAGYRRSLELLRRAKAVGTGMMTKSSLMLGLGETDAEVRAVLGDLRGAAVDFLTLGQYLQPTRHSLPVARYVPPRDFARLREYALDLGFRHVASGPLVRSSYQAHEAFGES